ncbi:E3 ubiquitin-protein ligase CCNB1IP1 [Diaporthe amygdali]|uniref:E3 ubiquitin-protein ligase CCNB1IP1 n=1 Tax=Phomopsis amygdali TaxID=1214568 RepID=UPI0022FE5A9E|nr:E3 ubiquitin-protein ligase CCNB1IP1 [Diaporthe amygdali]KAJ0113976.1 E3 ubiquitin-protein ligase CCNB1IP1 [Diaporthe amygdali]
MEHALRCNEIKCRVELRERALVTTCSHIFCVDCVSRSGFNGSAPEHRRCPACQSPLPRPDDAVITNLNPSEDYKTSVLSGLSPEAIMECAGRALSFWSYQMTQDLTWESHRCKVLTSRYSELSTSLDNIISDANAQLTNLQNKLASMALDHDSLNRKNEELVQAYKEKNRKLLQTQELYDKLKRRAMLGHIQDAASDAVDTTLQGGSSYAAQQAAQAERGAYEHQFATPLRPTHGARNCVRDWQGHLFPRCGPERTAPVYQLSVRRHIKALDLSIANEDQEGSEPSQTCDRASLSILLGRQGDLNFRPPAPFPAGLPDPLRCQPPFPARKRRASRSRRRRAGFTKEEKAILQHQLPAIAEEAHGDHGPVYELDASSQESVSSIVSVYELDASIQGSLSSIDPVYELEDTSSDNASEASLPSIVVSDYEPIIETNRQLKQENQQMCAFLQEIITRDIIVKEQLDRARGECKAASAALNLLWELVKSNFDGSEHVATPAQIVEFLSTRDIHDIPRLLQSGMKA